MNAESANRFIAALIKSLQTLCHGYVDFDDGIEIIGHLYLNIDSGSTFDYVLKEKVCKNAENSTVFVSKSFHAEGNPENTLVQNDKVLPQGSCQASMIGDNGISPSGTARIQSSISNISNVLSSNPEHHSSQSPLALNAAKRKRDQNGSYDNQNLPYKYTTLQSSTSSMPYFNNPSKQHPSSQDSTKRFEQSQGEFFTGDSNQSSGIAGEEEEDVNLDVTFVKQEYSDRQRAGQVSRTHQDPSSHQNMLPETSTSSGNFQIGFHPPGQNQQFVGSGSAGSGDISNNLNSSFQGPSQLDAGQHHIPPPPNPRNDATQGPPPRMPGGVKPLCGYVHPEDAKIWGMYELIPASGVFIHQENYNAVISKTRENKPDGKAMARYLMSCFWRQCELVGASIADPPKPHQRSLDRGIIHAILVGVHQLSEEKYSDLRKCLWQKLGSVLYHHQRRVKKDLIKFEQNGHAHAFEMDE